VDQLVHDLVDVARRTLTALHEELVPAIPDRSDERHPCIRTVRRRHREVEVAREVDQSTELGARRGRPDQPRQLVLMEERLMPDHEPDPEEPLPSLLGIHVSLPGEGEVVYREEGEGFGEIPERSDAIVQRPSDRVDDHVEIGGAACDDVEIIDELFDQGQLEANGFGSGRNRGRAFTDPPVRVGRVRAPPRIVDHHEVRPDRARHPQGRPRGGQPPIDP
jgi:hypothetical protein